MRLSTGIDGLDHILRGGLLPGRSYLVYGAAGTGKTTLGMHFLAVGENGLLITFAQSADQILADAASLGLSLDHVRIVDLSPSPETFSGMQTYDIFNPVEVEREPVTEQIARTITEIRPQRIFVDGFAHFRNLAGDAFQHRRFTQSFFRFATRDGATLIVSSADHDCAHDVDGVIQLDFSCEGRSLRVLKYRGSDFHAGSHTIRLTGTGLHVPMNGA